MSKGTIFKIAVGVLAVLGVVFAGIVVFYVMVYRAITSIEPGDPSDTLYSDIIVEHPPQWTPEGNHIVFSHLGAVYVVDSAGSRLQLVEGAGDNFATSPDVSPDGTRIAYIAYKHSTGWFPWNEDNDWEIVTSALDGSDRHRLTKNEGYDTTPVWSPDGSRITFISSTIYESIGIYVMAADGSDLRSVVKFADLEHSLGSSVYNLSLPPVWSPDGNHISFVVQIPGEHTKGMYVVGVDGSGLTRLLEDETSTPALVARRPSHSLCQACALGW